MAQPSSVQREPSMEEILASIRRIIEDSETPKKGENSAPKTSSPQAREEGVMRSAAIGVGEAARSVAMHELPAAPAEKPQPTEAVENAGTKTIDFVSIRPLAKLEPSSPEPSARAEAEVAAPEPELVRMEVEEPSVVMPDEEIVQPADGPSSQAPIMSEQSERKITLAFSELSEAYEARRKKSLADAAEEMLRPMLREWIDQNLPQMVERLVREEIERIARKS